MVISIIFIGVHRAGFKVREKIVLVVSFENFRQDHYQVIKLVYSPNETMFPQRKTTAKERKATTLRTMY